MWGGLPVRMLRFTPVRLHRTVRITARVHESASSRVRARLCRNRNQSAEPLETDHELRTLQVRDDPPHGRASFDFCSPDRPTRAGVFYSGRWQSVNVHVHSVNADVLTSLVLIGWDIYPKEDGLFTENACPRWVFPSVG